MSRFFQVMMAAKNIISNPHLMHQHMWKTNICSFGFGCKRNFQECAGAHFLEEYRPPMCLYLEFCEDSKCDKYHPHMGTVKDFVIYKGINGCLMTYNEWSHKKKRYDEIDRKAKEVISNPDMLKKHLYKTRKCFNGILCKIKDKCVGAHFLNEYRLPVCLKDEFCPDYIVRRADTSQTGDIAERSFSFVKSKRDDSKGCKNYHTCEYKDDYMKSQGISFEYNTQEEYISSLFSKDLSLLHPLTERIDVFSLGMNRLNPKAFTQLCSMVKDDKMCNKFGCTFAHTVDQLKGPIKDTIDIQLIPECYKRSIQENSSYENMIFEQNKMIEKIGKEDDEDDDYIHKLDFLTQEEAEEEQFFFELDFNPKFMDNISDIYGEEYEYDEECVRIDIPSISKIIEFEKMGILKTNVTCDI